MSFILEYSYLYEIRYKIHLMQRNSCIYPTKYSNVLSKKMKAANSKVFLVNTGWNGKGKRISLKDTRLIIDAILNDELNNVETQKIPFFNLEVPKRVNNISPDLLDPRSTWESISRLKKQHSDAKIDVFSIKKSRSRASVGGALGERG